MTVLLFPQLIIIVLCVANVISVLALFPARLPYFSGNVMLSLFRRGLAA